MTTTINEPAVAAAAERLAQAAATRMPCPPVRDLIGSHDVAAAYAVQQRTTATRLASGARLIGRKIGLTSPAVQTQLGVDRPDFGVLFDDMGYVDQGRVPMARLLQPKVEAEIAFVLARTLDEPLGEADLRSAVAYAVAALEVVDSRIADWDITYADTVADNASSGLYVLGTRHVSLGDVEPREVSMQMRINDSEVSVGHGSACLGDPLTALAWLATTALELGHPLREGDVVLSGALGPMAPVQAGDHVVAEISGLGAVSATFEGADL